MDGIEVLELWDIDAAENPVDLVVGGLPILSNLRSVVGVTVGNRMAVGD